MQKKIIAVAVMLGLQMMAGTVQAEGHKKASAAQAQTSKANPRYVINGGEVYDKKTDLTWQRCSIGQHWTNDAGCVGIIKEFTHDEAVAQADARWRLPDLDELHSMVIEQPEGAKRWMDEIAFPDQGDHMLYWSSRTNGVIDWDTGGRDPRGTPLSCTQAFGAKQGGNCYRPNYERWAVRLVRSGR